MKDEEILLDEFIKREYNNENIIISEDERESWRTSLSFHQYKKQYYIPIIKECIHNEINKVVCKVCINIIFLSELYNIKLYKFIMIIKNIRNILNKINIKTDKHMPFTLNNQKTSTFIAWIYIVMLTITGVYLYNIFSQYLFFSILLILQILICLDDLI